MRALGCVFVLACVGCGENYVYAPDTANSFSHGMPASRIQLPPEQPEGTLEVASFGIAQLRWGDTRVRALQVRMTVTNDGDQTPWRIDPRQQLVEIPGEGRAAPIYVNANAQTVPDVRVGIHQRRVLDLYYPLPSTIRGTEQLPNFELLWQVDTEARRVSSRTSFDRAIQENPYDYYGWDMWAGYGPYWWYDPLFPSRWFQHSHPIVIRDHRAPEVGRFNGWYRVDTGGQMARRR